MPEVERTHYRTCHLCEALCGIAIRVRGSSIVSIRGDDADPFSRGHLCPKAVAIQDVHEDPDRLRRPVRRTATGWQDISWEEAFDEAATRLLGIQSRHGHDAVATYFGNPQVHSYTGLVAGTQFVRALRTRNRYSATSVDQLPHHVAAYFMYGHQLLLPVPDLDRTDFLLVIGANPAVSNGSLMSAPDVARRLKDIRRRGGRLVVVDPRRTETAALADRHLFIRPGTDVLLLLALLHVIFEEGLAGPGRLAGCIDGLEDLRRWCGDYPPEKVDEATCRPVGSLLRAHGHLDPAVRCPLPVAHPGAQRRHRKPGRAWRGDVHPAGVRRRRPGERTRPTRGFRPATHPGARPA